MYDHVRYFTVTERHVPGTPLTLEERDEQLRQLYDEVRARRGQAKDSMRKALTGPAMQLHSPQSGDTPYGLHALHEECDVLAQTGEGARNTQLNRAAFRLGQLVAGHELTRSTVEQALYDAATQAGLPQREIERTLRSGLEAGMAASRSAPRGLPATMNHEYASEGTVPHPASEARGSFNLTDVGNAERFAARYGETVRWCETWKTWLVFNGKAWEEDRTGHVDQLAKATVRAIYHEAASEPDDAKRAQIVKHAKASESNRAIRALLDRAKSELPAVPEEFNQQLHLLNCHNGTLDLRTGELCPHDPRDRLTRFLKTKYVPDAACPKWEAFIDAVFAGDRDLIAFVQQALGMSLSGDISEQCLFICHGTGSNGKTTLLETVRILLGSYGLAANIETFQVHRNEGIRNDVAELYGARFVTASENALGSRLNEAFVKKVTGKEPLRARRLHENEFEFMPECSLWLAVNHKPVVKDTSHGMWRRVHFVPFGVTFTGKQINKRLVEELLEEVEGILAWLVRGCITWYQNGRLTIPKVVQAATEAYREEMDVVARFLSDECVLSPEKKAGATQLLARYEAWCAEQGERYDAKTFRTALHEKGYQSRRGAKGLWVWDGIGLIDNDGGPGDGGDYGDVTSQVFSRGTHTSQKTPKVTSPTVTHITPGSTGEYKQHSSCETSSHHERLGDVGDYGDVTSQVFSQEIQTSQKTPKVTSPTVTHVTQITIGEDDHPQREDAPASRDTRAAREVRYAVGGSLPSVHEEPSLQAKQDELASTCVVCGADVEYSSPEGVAYCEQHLPREDSSSSVEMTQEQFMHIVGRIAAVWPGGCTVHVDPPGYTLEEHMRPLKQER